MEATEEMIRVWEWYRTLDSLGIRKQVEEYIMVLCIDMDIDPEELEAL